jgi:hypothetical protein
LETISKFVGLDLELDKELQEIIDLACAVCQVPIALISFLDAKTQYLKVKKGLHPDTAPSKPRKDTFCTHTLKQDDVMIVPDSFKDPRFSHNPAITGDNDIHFYAGTPLVTNKGQKIGTLCVLDHHPGDLTEQQQKMLKIIARQAMKTIELKLKAIQLEESIKDIESKQDFFNDASIRLRSFFESSTNFHVLLGKHGELIDFNKTAFKFVKNAHRTNMKRGDIFVKYIAPDFVGKFIDGYCMALNGEKHVEEGSTDYGPLGLIYWDATFEAAYDNDNNIIGISYIIRDVTERNVREKKILEQNESLLHIAHMQAHEFRAPLTTIMGLIDLIKDDDYSMSQTYLDHLDQAVQNLDSKIKHIVSDINRVTAN